MSRKSRITISGNLFLLAAAATAWKSPSPKTRRRIVEDGLRAQPPDYSALKPAARMIRCARYRGLT